MGSNSLDLEYFDLQWLESIDVDSWQLESPQANQEEPEPEPETDKPLSPNRLAEHDLLDAEAEHTIAHQLQACFNRIVVELCHTPEGLDLLFDLCLDHYPMEESTLDHLLTQYDLYLVLKNQGEHQQQIDKPFAALVENLVRIPWQRDDLMELAQLQSSAHRNIHQLTQQLHRLRNRLVTANIRLVYHIALKYRDQGLELDDLIQEGILGLMRAAFKFDANAESRFSTYAYWWIKQAIKQAIGKQRSLIRYPMQIDQKIRIYHAFKERFRFTHGTAPNRQIIKENTSISYQQQKDLESLSNYCVSANNPLYDDGVKTLQDDLTASSIPGSNDANGPQEEHEQRSTSLFALKQLKCLTDREKKALLLKYGIGQRRAYSLREIAPQLGVSTERTRQIIQEALEKIRHQ